MAGEQLVMVLRPEPGQDIDGATRARTGVRNQTTASVQAHQRLRGLGERFSADRFAENQARRAGRADSRELATRRGRRPVSAVSEPVLAIVNPAAGGGRCGRLGEGGAGEAAGGRGRA